MQAGKQLLLEELSSDVRDNLDGLKKKGRLHVQGIKKKDSKYMCQAEYRARLFASFLCKRCNRVCMYCRKCITMGRVSECTVLVRGIAEKKGENDLNPLQWKGTLSTGQELAKVPCMLLSRKNHFYLGCVRCRKDRNVILRYCRGTSKRRKGLYRNAKDGCCT